MAYKSLIQQDWHAEAFRVGNAFQVVVNVGVDSDLGRTYSIAVGLEPLPGGAVEYYFYVTSLNEFSDEINAYYSGDETKNILPQVQRGAILRAFLHATKLLLAQVNPTSVSWCTWGTHLPQKALIKYLQVKRVFEAAGYTVQEGEPHNGRLMWSAERLRPPDFPFEQIEGNGK